MPVAGKPHEAAAEAGMEVWIAGGLNEGPAFGGLVEATRDRPGAGPGPWS